MLVLMLMLAWCMLDLFPCYLFAVHCFRCDFERHMEPTIYI